MQNVCTYSVRAIRRLHSAAVEQETDRVRSLALPLAERVHQFLEGCCPLDLEEHLVIVIRDFDIEMLADGLSFWLLRGSGASVIV